MISLDSEIINKEDIDELVEWLKTYPRLTKGPETVELEKQWSSWLGCNHSIFVNSGSSANLLMLYALKVSGKLKNNKVVVPGLSWATDLSPVMQLGLDPILCDCNLRNLSIETRHLREIFHIKRPSVLILVSVLGMVPDMDEILSLCSEYNVTLLEDGCESMGASFGENKIGTLGEMSSFSTYFGHHISTIEGGFVSTNDEDLYDVLLSLRSHGWGRDWSLDKQLNLKNKYNISDFDSQYSFYYPGFNLRSTDLQAHIGLGQLKKLDDRIQIRQNNFNLLQKAIKNEYWKPEETQNSVSSNFAYPIIHPGRNHIIKQLEGKVETRPILAGSMGRQPMYLDKYREVNLNNCDEVHNYGFYIPNHHGISSDDASVMAQLVNKAIEVCDVR